MENNVADRHNSNNKRKSQFDAMNYIAHRIVVRVYASHGLRVKRMKGNIKYRQLSSKSNNTLTHK